MCSGTDNRPGRARDDGELRLLAAVRQTIAEQGGPSRNIAVIDELLDERATAAPHGADGNGMGR